VSAMTDIGQLDFHGQMTADALIYQTKVTKL
jgi:hypothetical protein